jgi:hypothetical protein
MKLSRSEMQLPQGVTDKAHAVSIPRVKEGEAT